MSLFDGTQVGMANGRMGFNLVGDPNAVPEGDEIASYAGDNFVGGTEPAGDIGLPTETNLLIPPDDVSETPSYPSPVNGLSPTTGGVDPATVDPATALGEAGSLVGQVNGLKIDPYTAGTAIDGSDYDIDQRRLVGTAETVGTAQASSVTNPGTQTYTTAKATPSVNAMLAGAKAAQASVNKDALVKEDTFDMKGLATGINEDGTINPVGQSINTVYTQNISNVVDTSSVAGKILANALGEGNYTDAKTTVVGQMEILSEQFIGPDGQPRIPAFAAGAVKGVERMLAFSGVTGSAAIGAVAAATMESILPIAQADSKFFQTVTLTNLDAKNNQAINTANILSKMNVADLDARMTAAVSNAQTFMQYDFKNLANEQQMTVVKTQARQQAILEDSKQTNVQRRFTAEDTNQMNMFYSDLGAKIDQFNVAQKNANAQFNAGEINDMTEFNNTMINNREQFELGQQFNIDASNAKWRQTVTLTNTQMEFDAAATDVKNIAGLTSEQLNNMWDRTDALLDYSWKTGENAKDRNVSIWTSKLNFELGRYEAEMDSIIKKYGYDLDYDSKVYSTDKDFEIRKYQIQKEYKAAKINAIGSVIGSVVGAVGSVMSAAAISDQELKTNVKALRTMKNGVTLYKWDWTDEAKRLGFGSQNTRGVMAQNLQKTMPNAVSARDGYLRVDYNKGFAR